MGYFSALMENKNKSMAYSKDNSSISDHAEKDNASYKANTENKKIDSERKNVNNLNEASNDAIDSIEVEVSVLDQPETKNSMIESSRNKNDINEDDTLSTEYETIGTHLEKTQNENGEMFNLVKRHYKAILISNAVMFLINISLIATCLYGPPEMPLLPSINYDFNQWELSLPVMPSMNLVGYSKEYNLCLIVCVVAAALAIMTLGRMYFSATSQEGIKEDDATKDVKRIPRNENKVVSNKKTSKSASQGYGSMDSFDAEQVSAWLKEDIKKSNIEATNSKKHENIKESESSINVDPLEENGLKKLDSQNRLVKFVANNGDLVFWINALLTSLNALLIIVCFYGVPTINIPNICDIAPFAILCGALSCIMRCI